MATKQGRDAEGPSTASGEGGSGTSWSPAKCGHGSEGCSRFVEMNDSLACLRCGFRYAEHPSPEKADQP